MSKTLIELVNDVGKNLRRSTGRTYTTIDQDQTAVFMTSMINQAKRLVEDRWKWQQLRRNITFSSVAAVTRYDTSLIGGYATFPDVTNDRSVLLYDPRRCPLFWDVTTAGNGWAMNEVSREYTEHMINTVGQSAAIPSEFCIYQNGGGLTVAFPVAPTGVRSYKFHAYVPQEDLTNRADELGAPWRPVVLAATALCCEERGEEFGMPGSRWWDEYEQSISAAVGNDSDDRDFTLMPD